MRKRQISQPLTILEVTVEGTRVSVALALGENQVFKLLDCVFADVSRDQVVGEARQRDVVNGKVGFERCCRRVGLLVSEVLDTKWRYPIPRKKSASASLAGVALPNRAS